MNCHIQLNLYLFLEAAPLLPANTQPCPIIVAPQGLNLGGNVGLQRGGSLGFGSPVGFMQPRPGMIYNVNPNWLVPPSFSPDRPAPNLLGPQQIQPFSYSDYSTYPNTFDPWDRVGGGIGTSYGLGLDISGGHVIAPASSFGYPGCN